MLPDPTMLLETFQNPSMFHAAVVHLPIALTILLIPLIYVAIVADSKALRGVALAGFVLLAMTAFVAVRSGSLARDKVPNTLPKAIWDEINQHAYMGEQLWWFGLAGAILTGLSFIDRKKLRKATLCGALAVSLAAAGWTGLVGHLGGGLVYKHAIGTPGLAALHADGHPTAPVAPDGGMVEIGGTPADLEESWANPVDDGLNPKRLPFTLAEAREISYTDDVVPLLEFYCYDCHTPRRAEGELVMTTIEGLLKGGEKAGPSIIPGDPDASPAVKYIRGELQPQMPEKEEPLPPEELHILRLWIAAGAKAE